MIPGCAVLGCLEGVGLGVARCKRTLRDTIYAVLCIGVELSDAVPMNAGTVVRQRILDGDLNSIAPVGIDGRSRQLLVDEKTDTFAIAVWVAGCIGELEAVRHRIAGCWPLLVEVGGNAVAVAPARSGLCTVGAGCICHFGRGRRRARCRRSTRINHRGAQASARRLPSDQRWRGLRGCRPRDQRRRGSGGFLDRRCGSLRTADILLRGRRSALWTPEDMIFRDRLVR